MLHNICTVSTDIRPQFPTIEAEFVSTFYAMYMSKQWGAEMGYAYVPWPVACMRMEVVTWQLENDCGRLCTESLAQQL